MEKQFLILQHTTETPVGSTAEWLTSQGHSYLAQPVWRVKNWEQLKDFQNLVICGGSPNVDEDEKYPWLKEEKKLIEHYLKNERKTLGLCLGGQLISHVLGAKVGRHQHWEVGWHTVHIDNTHPFFNFSPKEMHVFQYHAYRFFLPEKAQRVATNHITEDQAFVWNNQAVGFQFHPEATKEWASDCALDQEDPVPKGPYCQSPEEILQGNRHQNDLRNWYFQFLSQFFK